MAEDQSGQKKDYLREFAPWTKLFGAFKVAMDPKKLLLAGAGILAMSLGWALLAAVYFDGFNKRVPQPTDFKASDYDNNEEAAWKAFKDARRHWNLAYEMAGSLPATLKEVKELKEEQFYVYDAADYAETLKEYNDIKKAQDQIRDELKLRDTPVTRTEGGATNLFLKVGENKVQIQGKKEDVKQVELWIKDGRVRLGDIRITGKDKALVMNIKELPFKVFEGEENLAEDLKVLIFKARNEEDIRREAERGERDPRVTAKALDLRTAKLKPHGRLRMLPWFEDRGPNPYLLVTGNVESTGTQGTVRNVPWERGEFITWVGNDQAPVLLEPLIKFLRPIIYLLDPAAGGWNRIYLFLVILWALAVWGFFGGAITRMAAVQVARPNEKVGLTEAVRFAWHRYKSFFLAPLFPLIFLAALSLFLIVFGLFEKNIPVIGDIVFAGLLWPVVLLVGLIMAIVLVGLIGWPLMYPTISTEGSDSFDAISRSYSYIYQAPWQYAWYCAVALVYGAVLIFFVGLMGSLMVYLGKWGVAQAPTPFNGRDTQYLFSYAPTSFGWRDLLLHKSPDVQTVEVIRGSGQIGKTYVLNESVTRDLQVHNTVGAFLVSVWLYILFLMIVGFGYSYFWSVSTIIYILMRRNVDDTEMDEVHLEQTEPELPFPTPPPTNATPSPTAPAAAKPGLTLVEPPTLRPPANPTQLAPPLSPVAPTPLPTPVTPPVAPPSELSATPSPAPASPATDHHEPTTSHDGGTGDGTHTHGGATEAEGNRP